MASQQQTPGPGSSPVPAPGYKRASRKGAPKKFPCDWPDCDKIYSRPVEACFHECAVRDLEGAFLAAARARRAGRQTIATVGDVEIDWIWGRYRIVM
ncbi:hypothetical protein NUW58_g5091 [Xylaria curta]|uniref:Uncharacterized protein n=1 Tax=Xylaria curta TaxID=42375 RepID=A0ACC1P3B3_9PEZI|nr:hypothetical protein NUW58_g5091 [Xylaria curta]